MTLPGKAAAAWASLPGEAQSGYRVYPDPPMFYLFGGPNKNPNQKPYQTQQGTTLEGLGRVGDSGFRVHGIGFLVMWDPMGGWVFVNCLIMLLNKLIFGLEMC